MKIEKDKYYLIRTEDTSVYFGRITEKDGQEVTMTECRCIWYWRGAASLNQLVSLPLLLTRLLLSALWRYYFVRRMRRTILRR